MNEQSKMQLPVGNKNKNICEVRQVMQSENCVLAKRLKLCWWIDLLSHVGGTLVWKDCKRMKT